MVKGAATESGYALMHRYAQKWDKYGPKCEAEGMVFQPMPIEVLGGWHKAGIDVVSRIGQSMARATRQEEGEAIRHLFGKLSVLLMRGSAQLILNRLPHD